MRAFSLLRKAPVDTIFRSNGDVICEWEEGRFPSLNILEGNKMDLMSVDESELLFSSSL